MHSECMYYLLAVFMLLKGKDMLVEVFLKFLISKIDVELFKSIHFEILEPKNVEHSNKGKLVLPSSDSDINSLQNPPKQVGIDSHRSRITRIFSLNTKNVKEKDYYVSRPQAHSQLFNVAR